MSEETTQMFAREVIDRVCIAQHIKRFATTKKFHFFQPQDIFTSSPLSLASIGRFCKLLDHELSAFPDLKIVLCAPPEKRARAAAVLLMGAYMLLRKTLVTTTDKVVACFHWLPLSSLDLDGFLDQSAGSDCVLTLRDYWRGLELGRAAGWLNVAGERHCDPRYGDVHELVPGRLVAIGGRRRMADWQSEDGSERPDYCAQSLWDLGVKAVVRLSESECDAGAVAAAGIAHHHLPFDDAAAPPDGVVREILAVVDGAAGAVAVDWGDGRGRAGTLAAVWLMRRGGLEAREALAWLRMVLPGSTAGGAQLRYLCAMEAAGCVAARLLRAGHVSGYQRAGLAGAHWSRRGCIAFIPSKARRAAGARQSCSLVLKRG